MPTQAESPTAFLEMLSSAATSTQHMPDGSGSNMFAGLTPMWTSADRTETTGLTPFLPMPEPDFEASASTPSGGGRYHRPSDTPMLSPNNIFNFSPAPTGPGVQAPSGSGSDTPATYSMSSVLNIAQQMGGLTGVSSLGGAHVPTMPPGSTNNMGPPLSEDIRINLQNAATSLANGGGGDANMEHNSTTSKNKSQSSSFDSDPISAMAADGVLDSRMFMDLFWPGWPPNLPDPNVVQQLVEAFFDIVPNMPRMLHRARFLARLSLPATHSNFPHPALLHSICALAASWCKPEVYEDSPPPNFDAKMAFFAHSTPKPKYPSAMPFSLQQAAHGKDAVLDGLNTGNRLFDVVRAMIILSRVFIDDTRMLECWTYCGLVSRMILPLGLNVRSAELSLKSVMLPPAADALEREERRVVVWMAMYHDTVASAASGWGTSLALDELTVPLPVSKRDFDEGNENMEPNPQDLESLDLYIKHPVPDALVMALKASVLLNRVNKFARKWKNRRMRDNDDLDGMLRPEFRELANAIACLQMSFPPTLTNPTTFDDRGMLDVDLVSAHVLPHTAIICLYEPFADVTDPNDQPARRILNAARSVINVIQQLVGIVPKGVTNIGAVMHSSSSVALVTAARTCLLFYRHALNIGDLPTAEAYRTDVDTARLALAQYGRKFKIGYHHAQLIDYFLDRATNPTFEKLAAHYPEHPRVGGLALTPESNFGLCILNALNIKRGFWKLPPGGYGNSGSVSISTMSPSGISPANSNGNSNNNPSPNESGSGSTPDLLHRNSTASTGSSSDSPMSGIAVGAGVAGSWNAAANGTANGNENRTPRPTSMKEAQILWEETRRRAGRDVPMTASTPSSHFDSVADGSGNGSGSGSGNGTGNGNGNGNSGHAPAMTMQY